MFLKRVRRNSADKNALEREMRIYEELMRISTTNVLQVLDFIRDDEYVGLVMEFADGGDLQTQDLMIKRLQWHEKTLWMFKSYLKN